MKKIIINTDGGSRGNPGPAAIGVIIKDDSGILFYKYAEYIGVATNNQAEYRAVLKAVQWLANNPGIVERHQEILFNLDSQLAVYQLNGKYKIKNSGLLKLIQLIKSNENLINRPIKYQHIRRYLNDSVDQLLNQELDRVSKTN